MQNRPACVSLLSIPTAQQADGKLAGFKGLAYSGGVVPNHGWAGDLAIDLSSVTFDDEIAVLLNHNPDQIVGRARLANTGTELEVVAGSFSTVTEHGKTASALMAEGHPWKLSVGMNGRMSSVDRAKPVALNGRKLVIDSVIRGARIVELSFVPAGADPNAYAAQLSARLGITPPNEDAHMNDEQAQARIAELEAQVRTLTGERDAARTELAAAQASLTAAATARRNDQITALFGADAELTDEQRAAYVAMTDAQFAAVDAALQAERRAADPALFTQQARSGRNPDAAGPVTFAAPQGYGVDASRAMLHAKIVKHAADHKTDYLTAALAVERGA